MIAPIDRLIKLLDSGVVKGIGDALDGKTLREATERDRFATFLEEHRTRRLPMDSHKRDPQDSLFHYKMDVANNCLTLAASELEGVRAFFVTPTPLNVQQCTKGPTTFARLERTPLYILNASRMLKEGIIADEAKFFKAAAREALELVRDLNNYERLEQCPNHLQLRLSRFYTDYVSLLNRARLPSQHHVADESVEEMIRHLRDKNQLQKMLDDAVQDVRDGARLVELQETSFDFPYIEQFDFSDDPVLNRIKGELGISLNQ